MAKERKIVHKGGGGGAAQQVWYRQKGVLATEPADPRRIIECGASSIAHRWNPAKSRLSINF